MAATTKRRNNQRWMMQEYVVTYVPTGQKYPQNQNMICGAVETAVAEWRRPLPPGVLRDNTFLTKTVNWIDDSVNKKSGMVGNFDYVECAGNSGWSNDHPPRPYWAPLTVREMSESQADGVSISMYGKASSKFTGGAIDFGETLGGFRQTVSMINKRVKTLTVFAKLVSARNWKQLRHKFGVGRGAWENSGSFANAMLELQFGWRPIIQDIYDSLELSHKRLRNGQRRSARSGLLSTKDQPVTGAAMPTFGGKAGISGLVESEVAANLNNLGLANPSLTAWQILPFSFVVDWFLPISQILAGLSTSVGMTAMFGWRISVYGNELRNANYGAQSRTKYVKRVPVTGLTPVWPQLKYFRAVNDEISKVAISVALLRQQLDDGRKIKRYLSTNPRA